MVERLFTYGSLMPGGQYAHLLIPADGNWQPANVTGFTDANGWGHSVGYPSLLVHGGGRLIPGMLLTSSRLATLWPLLDEFEGDAYQRISTTVTLADGSTVTAHVYELHHNLQAGIRKKLDLI